MPNFKSNNKSLRDSITKLEVDDAIAFIQHLASTNQDVKKQLQKFLKDKWRLESDVEDIASAVQADLEMLEVEDVWDESGKTRYGYRDPSDVVAEMFDSALSPYEIQLNKRIKAGSLTSAKRTCMGILLGIYRFEHESATEFLDWVTDIPRDRFHGIVEHWKTILNSKRADAELSAFVLEKCPLWAKNKKS